MNNKCRNVSCSASFRWPMQLSRHMSKCLFPPPPSNKKYFKVGGFQCCACSKIFQHQSDVCAHVPICKGSEPQSKEWPCPKCTMTFPYECRLKKHLECHNKDMCCLKCNRTFKRKDCFDSHVVKCEKQK